MCNPFASTKTAARNKKEHTGPYRPKGKTTSASACSTLDNPYQPSNTLSEVTHGSQSTLELVHVRLDPPLQKERHQHSTKTLICVAAQTADGRWHKRAPWGPLTTVDESLQGKPSDEFSRAHWVLSLAASKSLARRNHGLAKEGASQPVRRAMRSNASCTAGFSTSIS